MEVVFFMSNIEPMHQNSKNVLLYELKNHGFSKNEVSKLKDGETFEKSGVWFWAEERKN